MASTNSAATLQPRCEIQLAICALWSGIERSCSACRPVETRRYTAALIDAAAPSGDCDLAFIVILRRFQISYHPTHVSASARCLVWAESRFQSTTYAVTCWPWQAQPRRTRDGVDVH